MEQLLYDRGYRLHCTYTTLNGNELRCYIRFNFNTNTYAFVIEDTVLAEGLNGKYEANSYFKNNLMSMVNPGSKVLAKRNHLYGIHYYAGPRSRDMVMLKSSDLSISEISEWWNELYKFAIANHGYKLCRVEEIY